MRSSFRLSLAALMIGALAALLPAPASRAAPNPPIAGYPQNSDIGAVLSNTLHGTGTVTAAPTTPNNAWRGVRCTFLLTVSSGSPTETWSIEAFDAATNTWQQIATTDTFQWGSGSLTATTQSLTAYPGVATSLLSTGNTAQSTNVPRLWRLKDVIGGSAGNTPAVTSKAGCNYLD